MQENSFKDCYGEKVLRAYRKISDQFNNFTLLMRERIPYQEWGNDLQETVEKEGGQQKVFASYHGLDDLILKIQDMGRVEEAIRRILDDDLFDKTSKHHPYWQSEHEPEADKFHDLRLKIACFQDNLWDVVGLLRRNERAE